MNNAYGADRKTLARNSSASNRLDNRRLSGNKPVVNRDIRKCPNGRTPSRKPNIVTVKKKAKTPFPIGTVFTCVVLTSLLLFVMVYFAEIDKLSNQMTKLSKEIAVLENSERKLSEKLDARDDIDMIKKRAIEMGMVSSDLLDHQYINLTNDDKTEIVQLETGKSGFGFMLSGIRELFEGFFDN